MSIIDVIKKEKDKFQAKRERQQSVRLNRNLEKSKKDYANAKIKETIIKNREYSNNIRSQERAQRLAPFKAFGRAVTQRTAKRASKNKIRFGANNAPLREQGNIFTQSSGYNPLYHGSSNTGASNPYNFSGSKPLKAKSKKRRVIIQL